MSSWSDGYVSDIEYTTAFFRELSPDYLAFAVNTLGFAAPDTTRPYSFCELACGQGLTTNVLAAANPRGTFYGYDFNPSQIANAKALARAAGLTNITFEEESFETLANKAPGALPKFDFIVLHGIYSWISRENQEHIIRFLHDRLVPGGLVYVSYNCYPGWTGVAPMQRLMREHAMLNPARSDVQVDAALAFVNKMIAQEAGYFHKNSGLDKRLETIKGQNKHYLAHEYLNQYWIPIYFADAARDMERAKLSFACSATLTDNIENTSTGSKIKAIMDEVSDPIMKQMLRDYTINQQFRRDIYLRGLTRLNQHQANQTWAARKFVLQVAREEFSSKVKTAVGEIQLIDAIANPLADLLASGPQTLGQLTANPDLRSHGSMSILRALTMSAANGFVHPVADQNDARPAIAFNRAVAAQVLDGVDLHNMAAPMIGSGIRANFFEFAAYVALLESPAIDADGLSRKVWTNMQRNGRRIVKDGKPLETEAENLVEVGERTKAILSQRVPVWKRLNLLPA